MSIRQRIAASLAANTFGQVVTIGSQVLLTPMYFRYWGAAQYGEWLILSTVPAYLGMADLGISSAAGNEMAIRSGAGDRAGAQQTFRGAQSVAMVASMFTLLIGLLAALAAWKLGIPKTGVISAADSGGTILLLAVGVALGFYGAVVQAGFRCAGLNAFGITWSNISRLSEALVAGFMLFSGFGALMLCAATLVARLLMLLAQWVSLWHQCPWLFHPKVDKDPHMVRRLMLPSLAFLAFPLGNALALQGPVLLIGSLYGGTAVALFSAMRTLARLPVQITNALNNSVSPEISRAHGQANDALVRTLHRQSWLTTVSLSLLALLGLVVLGPWLTKLWLGPGHYSPLMLHALAAVSLISAAWNISSVVLTAVNAHARLAFMYVLVNGACLGLATGLGKWAGMEGLLACLLLAEVLMLAWVLPTVLKQTQDSLSGFMGGLRIKLPGTQ